MVLQEFRDHRHRGTSQSMGRRFLPMPCQLAGRFRQRLAQGPLVDGQVDQRRQYAQRTGALWLHDERFWRTLDQPNASNSSETAGRQSSNTDNWTPGVQSRAQRLRFSSGVNFRGETT